MCTLQKNIIDKQSKLVYKKSQATNIFCIRIYAQIAFADAPVLYRALF
jgi:hypothetical protein